MAKTNLNPGADATLVSAAYRSAAGNTPGDYSGALESVVQGYEKTMEAQSEAWGNIAKLGANIGGEMMANAEELTSYAAKASGLDADAAKFLTDEIYANKDAQKELGLFGGRFGDREIRKERAELKLKQKELFAEIDLAVESINVGADNIANGLYDAELANLNEGDAEKVNAIIKSNLKDKNTENGNYAKLGRDENTGELMYTLYDSDTNEPTMLNGKPQTMTIKEFNKSIANNVKDTKNVVGTNLGGIINDIVTGAQKGRNSVIAPQMTQMGLNRLDSALQTDTDLRRAMLSKYGMKNTSFVDDITSKGKVSADLYGSMLKQLGLGQGGQIPATGAFEGIADTDGTKGLSLDEVNAAYGTYVNNIIGLKDIDASRAAFKASFTDRMADAHKYGYSNRAIKPGGKTSTGTNPYGKGAVIPGFNSAGWQTGETLQKRRNQAENNYPFTGVAGKYKPDGNGMWILNDDKENPMSTYSVFDQEGLIQSGDTPEQYGTQQEIKQEFETSNIDIFKNSNQSSAITKINNLYDFNSSGIDIVKIPTALDKVFGGVLGAGLRMAGYKDDTLIVKGPKGGYISWEDFQQGNLVEYGGNSGNKIPRGLQPLSFSLQQDHENAQNMLEKLEKLADIAGVNQTIATPMSPVIGGGGAADEF